MGTTLQQAFHQNKINAQQTTSSAFDDKSSALG